MASSGFQYFTNSGPAYPGNSGSYGASGHGGSHGGHGVGHGGYGGGYGGSHGGFPYHHHHQQQQPQPPTPPTPMAFCRWGNCGVILDELTGPAIKRHLQQFHDADMPPKGNAGQSGGSTRCQWTDESGSCDTECRSTVAHGRHVSTVHLGQGRMECMYCTKKFSRKDALKRHQEQYCPVLQHGPTLGM